MKKFFVLFTFAFLSLSQVSYSQSVWEKAKSTVMSEATQKKADSLLVKANEQSRAAMSEATQKLKQVTDSSGQYVAKANQSLDSLGATASSIASKTKETGVKAAEEVSSLWSKIKFWIYLLIFIVVLLLVLHAIAEVRGTVSMVHEIMMMLGLRGRSSESRSYVRRDRSSGSYDGGDSDGDGD